MEGLPTRLGKYEILSPLAAGGMARIYIGRTTGIGSFERHVVLKLITPERANDVTAVQMFLDEARLAASLNHQNVAQVFEVGQEHGIHYLAMEYVHGQDMRGLLAKAGADGTRVPLDLALAIVTGAAAGLHHAHERRGNDGVPLGIVHRDVSPSNIMIGYDGSVKLLDFGIAKATMRSVETQSGIIKGKFAYMAPEQCRGRAVDPRSDVFSLGIILYEATTQHRCFRADNDFDTMHRIVTGDVVRPSRVIAGYPAALEAIVMKALAVDANQRYQSAGALLEAIESFAVNARMSLSTMSLGRFMRDMFGDQPEPWLVAGQGGEPVSPRESTVSNTNGSRAGRVPAAATQKLQTGPAETAPAPADSDDDDDDAGASAAMTTLDLPRGLRVDIDEGDAPNPAEWNAKSYPTLKQGSQESGRVRQGASAMPGGQLRPSSPALPIVAPPSKQFDVAVPRTGSGPAAPALGSQPLAVQRAVPANQFPTGAGSSSGTVRPVSTRHGYASAAPTRGDSTRGDPSQGRVARPPAPAPAPAVEAAAAPVRSNRRALFIGLGIAVAGVVVLLVTTLGGGGATPSQAPEEPRIEPIRMDQRSDIAGSAASLTPVVPVAAGSAGPATGSAASATPEVPAAGSAGSATGSAATVTPASTAPATGAPKASRTPKAATCQQPQYYDAFDARPVCK